MTISTVLLLLAFISFIVALVDAPRFSATRCIALGLALVVLAQLVAVMR